jgi:hypothetical protein
LQFTVTLVNDAPFMGAPGMGWVTADLGRAEIAGPATIDVGGNQIPGHWIIYEYGYDPEPMMWWAIENTQPGGGNTLAGDLLRITLHCSGLGDVVVTVWDTDGVEPLATAIIHQIPEPASLLLLGLGGLFLRRK